MATKDNPEHLLLLAKGVEEAVIGCLFNAQRAETEADANRWFNHAQLLEQKFKTDYGKHYSCLTRPETVVYFT